MKLRKHTPPLTEYSPRPERRKRRLSRVVAVIGVCVLSASLLENWLDRDTSKDARILPPLEESVGRKSPYRGTILNWNINAGRDQYGAGNITSIILEIEKYQPDIAFLTEVRLDDVPAIQQTMPTAHAVYDPAEALPRVNTHTPKADREDWNALEVTDAVKGNLLLIGNHFAGDREDIKVASQQLDRPSSDYASRTVAMVTTEFAQYVITHLEAKSSSIRASQAEQVEDFIAEHRDSEKPLFLGGDLNADTNSSVIDTLTPLGREAISCNGATLVKIDAQVDWLINERGSRPSPFEYLGRCAVVPTRQSDHYPTLITFEQILSPPAPEITPIQYLDEN